jgi:hypothetical protein
MAALAAGSLLGAMAASAGTKLTVESQRVGVSQGSPRRVATQVDGDRMRVDGADGRHTVLYDAGSGTVLVLDHRDRTYHELDQKSVVAVAERMQQAGSEVRNRLQSLPQEQREAAERLLEQTLGISARQVPEVKIHPTEELDQVEGTRCREYMVMRDGVRVATACTAAFADLGVSSASLAPVRAMGRFAGEVGRLLPGGVSDAGLDAFQWLQEVDGLPVRVRNWSGDTIERVTYLRDVREEPVPAATFALPDGYTRQLNVTIRGAGGSVAAPPAAEGGAAAP